MPMSTNTMIATCVQTHVEGIARSVARPAIALRSIVSPMHRRLSRSVPALLLALAAALAALGALAPASGAAVGGASSRTLLAGVNVPAVGYAANPASADRLIAAVRGLHVGAIRVEVPWPVFEPRGTGAIDARAQAYADRLAADAAAAHIELVMTVEGSPCWASSAPPALLRACRPGRNSRANSYPPREPRQYAAFAAYLATRYAPELAAIEVWNEPDQVNEDYFAGPQKARRYAAVLRAAYPAIKAAAPAVQVLGGSLVGSNGVFLRALYAAGIKGYYDGLSVHYYNLTLASLRSIHEAQLAAGDTRPLWLDEFGWSSCWPRRRIQQEQGCVTSQTQALNLTNTLRALARMRYVATAVVYKLQDSPGEDFGLLTARGAHKPSFRALAGLLPAFGGNVSRVTVSLRAHGGAVLASGSGPVGDFMLLEAFQGATLRYRAVFTLDRFNRYSLTLPAVLGTSGLTVRVYQYGAGPGSGAQASI